MAGLERSRIILWSAGILRLCDREPAFRSNAKKQKKTNSAFFIPSHFSNEFLSLTETWSGTGAHGDKNYPLVLTGYRKNLLSGYCNAGAATVAGAHA